MISELSNWQMHNVSPFHNANINIIYNENYAAKPQWWNTKFWLNDVCIVLMCVGTRIVRGSKYEENYNSFPMPPSWPAQSWEEDVLSLMWSPPGFYRPISFQ